ncbi:hypothetical protein EIP91_000726 [Steccherinum ochraceum]|uniref:cAMP-dependent protein kinase regulatory subunit n=1 Tax=Steccherinum ochraceum TaxID=92696 RepID=A0A4R0RT04_9APHY|nr:hypothetical protein EIP91_000726 [Steccherinum ochraceum]
MATFDSLIADLTRDVLRVQPTDALQFCANWFQSRLEEQRTRTRDALASAHAHPSSSSLNLPRDHYLDTPLHPSSASSSVAKHAPSRPSTMDSSSPFGTLNVPGNALLSGDSRSSRGTLNQGPFNPTFSFDGADTSPSSPTDTSESPNPFASFANGSVVSPDDGDYLHAPSATIFARRTSVSAESIAVDQESNEPLPVFPKTPDQLRRIRAATANNFIFRDLDEEQEIGALNAMQELRVGKDEVVIRQGDVGEYFYVVERGLLHCYIRSEPPPPFASNATSSPEKFLLPGYHPEFGKKVADCGEGSSFGELALMYGHPRAASVVSLEPCTLWSLDRITFRTIILKAAHRRRTMYEHFLSAVPLLESLGPEDRSKIADALVSRVYSDEQAVVKQGEMGDTFFFVEEGEAIVTKSTPGEDGGAEKVINHLRKGDYFGELSLLRLEPRAATVSAIKRTDPSQPKLKVAALDAHAFTRLLGPLREIMDRHAGQAY